MVDQHKDKQVRDSVKDYEPRWSRNLTERQWQEVKFSQAYIDSFAHGTDGHNRLELIAKMASILTEQEKERGEDQVTDNTFFKIRDEYMRAVKALVGARTNAEMGHACLGYETVLEVRISAAVAVRRLRHVSLQTAYNMLEGALAVIQDAKP